MKFVLHVSPTCDGKGKNNMSKFTGKKKKLNYRPIFYVAAVAIPLLIVITILIKPPKITPLEFAEKPTFDAHLSKAGTLHIHWKVNQPANCILYYRFDSKKKFQEMSTAFGDRFVVAIPAKPKNTIEFYIKVNASRQEILSKRFEVKLLPYTPASKSATKPKDG